MARRGLVLLAAAAFLLCASAGCAGQGTQTPEGSPDPSGTVGVPSGEPETSASPSESDGTLQDGYRTVAVENSTGSEITGLYVRVSGEEDWGENALLDVLPKGRSEVRLHLPDGTEGVLYDIRLTGDNNEEFQYLSFTLDGISSLEFGEYGAVR